MGFEVKSLDGDAVRAHLDVLHLSAQPTLRLRCVPGPHDVKGFVDDERAVPDGRRQELDDVTVGRGVYGVLDGRESGRTGFDGADGQDILGVDAAGEKGEDGQRMHRAKHDPGGGQG